MIENLVLQSLVYQAKNDIDHAVRRLRQSFSLAEPGGFVRAFVDEGPPMVHLLNKAIKHGIAPDYVGRLLAAFPTKTEDHFEPSVSQSQEYELIEPLSERELEVLQLIAEGLTNQEIANRLFLSLNTVKVHTRNFYSKLDVHTRTQAVAKARGIGLLPDF